MKLGIQIFVINFSGAFKLSTKGKNIKTNFCRWIFSLIIMVYFFKEAGNFVLAPTMSDKLPLVGVYLYQAHKIFHEILSV